MSTTTHTFVTPEEDRQYDAVLQGLARRPEFKTLGNYAGTYGLKPWMVEDLEQFRRLKPKIVYIIDNHVSMTKLAAEIFDASGQTQTRWDQLRDDFMHFMWLFLTLVPQVTIYSYNSGPYLISNFEHAIDCFDQHRPNATTVPLCSLLSRIWATHADPEILVTYVGIDGRPSGPEETIPELGSILYGRNKQRFPLCLMLCSQDLRDVNFIYSFDRGAAGFDLLETYIEVKLHTEVVPLKARTKSLWYIKGILGSTNPKYSTIDTAVLSHTSSGPRLCCCIL